MKEVVKRVNMNHDIGCVREMKQNYCENAAKFSAVNTQKAELVRGICEVSLNDLEKTLESKCLQKCLKSNHCDFSNSMTSIAQRFPENGLETLVSLLKEFFADKFRAAGDIRHVPIEVTSSAIILLIRTSHL